MRSEEPFVTQSEIMEIPAKTRGNGMRGAVVVFGGQAGSEGKGAIAGYLARRNHWGAAINAFMTNAGHTFIDDNGDSVVVQQLPVALVSPDVEYLLISGGAAITLDQLQSEIERYDSTYDVVRRLRIDPRAVIITDEHKQQEADVLKRVASTMKGCGAALAQKAMRDPRVTLARDIAWLKPFLADTAEIANKQINYGSPVLVEGAQGFDLDINHGIEYPYCTSRGCTPMAVMADCGIAPSVVTRSIAVIRTFPIRVGNIDEGGVQVGNSGPFGGRELSWDQISARAGKDVIERTTVTQRVRRVFEIDLDRLSYMSLVCRPTDIALTFADYVDASAAGLNTQTCRGRLPSELARFVYSVQRAVHRNIAAPRVNLIKTGARNDEIIDWFGRHWQSM